MRAGMDLHHDLRGPVLLSTLSPRKAMEHQHSGGPVATVDLLRTFTR